MFKHFETKDGNFFCFPMETNHASVTPMYNTYRASQFMFPGDDDVLARAGRYCRAFLQERQASNKLHDKWIITKDLPGEVVCSNKFQLIIYMYASIGLLFNALNSQQIDEPFLL